MAEPNITHKLVEQIGLEGLSAYDWYWYLPWKERRILMAAVARWRDRTRSIHSPSTLRLKGVAGRISANIRSAVNDCLRRPNTAPERIGDLNARLGYTIQQLKIHLERQFLKGMTWDNYGKHGWHVDHIIALSSFTFTSFDDPEFKAAWAMSNLRPLWAGDNIRKSNKRTHLL